LLFSEALLYEKSAGAPRVRNFVNKFKKARHFSANLVTTITAVATAKAQNNAGLRQEHAQAEAAINELER